MTEHRAALSEDVQKEVDQIAQQMLAMQGNFQAQIVALGNYDLRRQGLDPTRYFINIRPDSKVEIVERPSMPVVPAPPNGVMNRTQPRAVLKASKG